MKHAHRARLCRPRRGEIHVFRDGARAVRRRELHVIEQKDLPEKRGQGPPAACITSRFRTPNERSNTMGWAAAPERTLVFAIAARSIASIFAVFIFREPNGILFEIAPNGPGFCDRLSRWATARRKDKLSAAALPRAAPRPNRGRAEAALHRTGSIRDRGEAPALRAAPLKMA